MPTLLLPTELTRSLAIPDLTDNSVAPDHALQKLITLTHCALQQAWQCTTQIIRSSPVVSIKNNYDRLNYPTDGASRDARYTRYVTGDYILRTQTSSAIPDLLAGLNGSSPPDHLWLLPGIVYRRDCIDRLHCAEPHQLDIWRLVDHRYQTQMTTPDLDSLIEQVMKALVPGMTWRTVSSPHPYTTQGRQIDVEWQGEWVEVGECGLIHPALLDAAKLKTHSGLAMGLGLDRLLMIRKNIPDIRLLRSQDHRVQDQMNDLSRYRPVSNQPPIRRDLSLVVSKHMDEEQIGDRVRSHTHYAPVIESLTIEGEDTYDQLPEHVVSKLQLMPDQKNVLLRLVMRDLDETLSAADANKIRNDIYELLHEGSVFETASDRGC